MPQKGSDNKQASKSAQKDKASTHAADLAMGLTSTMQKAMRGDSVICTACEATVLGPKLACECAGGRSKPGADYDPKMVLFKAATARQAAGHQAKMSANAAAQSQVQAAKAKRAAAKEVDGLEDLDLGAMALAARTDMKSAAFEPGAKLGFALERNAVCRVADGEAAAAAGVCVGWVVRQVNGAEAPANKAALMKAAAAAMKGGPVTLTFQTPAEAGAQFCKDCDKFVEAASFDGAQLEKGPGKQVCSSCEEYAEMFG